MKKSSFAILGGGIAGLSMAIALGKYGYPSTIFEADSSIRTAGAGLAVAANAMKAFNSLGIYNEILDNGKEIARLDILDESGKLLTTTDATKLRARFGISNFSIHRHNLHNILLKHASKTAAIITGKNCTSVTQNINGVTINFKDGSCYTFDYLIDAGGIHSAVRKQLLPFSKPRYAGYTCRRAVIQADWFHGDIASETWGRKGRFGIVPLADGKIYWYACINAKEKDETIRNLDAEKLSEHFQGYHHPIEYIISMTPNSAMIHNDISDLAPIKNYAFGNIVLIGDAAHATTPNMGQGACQAIEDSIVLADEIHRCDSPSVAFKEYESRRLNRTHWIVQQSRTIGRVAQIQNSIAIKLRNNLLSLMPQKINESRLERLYKVDF